MAACPKPEKKVKKSRFTKKVKEPQKIGLFQKTPKKKKEKPSTTKKKCDTIWGQVVRKNQPLCLWCGKRAAIHAHHIFTRQCIPTRHVILNGAALCGGCHMRAHQHSALFTDFIRDKMGVVAYIQLKSLAYQPFEKADYQARKEVLLTLQEEQNEQHQNGNREVAHADRVPHQETPEAVQKETEGEEDDLERLNDPFE